MCPTKKGDGEMENKKLITLIITLAIGIILTVSLLIPVIQGSIDGMEIKYENGPQSSSVNLATYSTNADFDITMVKNGDTWEITGIDVNPLAGGSYMITDNLLIVLSSAYGYNIRGLNESQVFVTLIPNDWNGVTTNVTSVSIDVTPTSITVSDANSVQSSYTFPSTYAIYSDLDGDRVICTNLKEVYTSGGSDIISLGLNNTKFFWTTNGADSKAVFNATLLDTTLNCPLTEVSADVDKIEVGVGGDYTVTAAYNDSSYDLAPQYVSVPKTVIQQSEIEDSIRPLLTAIPLIVMLGLVIFTAGAAIRKD